MKTNKTTIKFQYYKQLLKGSSLMPLVLSLPSCSQKSTYALTNKSTGNPIKYEIKHSTAEEFRKKINNTGNIGNVVHNTDLLYVAVGLNDSEAVKMILNRISDDDNIKKNAYEFSFPNRIHTHSKRTPLGKAIDLNYKEIVKLLVEHCSIDVYDTGEGLNALLLALHNKNEKMAEVICDSYVKRRKKGINPSHSNHANRGDMLRSIDGLSANTPLLLSIQRGYITLAENLIEQLCVNDLLYTETEKGRNALHMAAMYQREDLFKQIFNKIKREVGVSTAIGELLKKDKKERSVWACAYLSYHGSSGKEMFDFMLKLTTNDLSDKVRTTISQELKNFYDKGAIRRCGLIARSKLNKLCQHLHMKYRDFGALQTNDSSNSNLTASSTTTSLSGSFTSITEGSINGSPGLSPIPLSTSVPHNVPPAPPLHGFSGITKGNVNGSPTQVVSPILPSTPRPCNVPPAPPLHGFSGITKGNVNGSLTQGTSRNSSLPPPPPLLKGFAQAKPPLVKKPLINKTSGINNVNGGNPSLMEELSEKLKKKGILVGPK